jgi:heme iron utilization protein
MTEASPLRSAAADVAALMSGAATAALGTLDAATGFPYVSFVTVALDTDGSPLLLISKLARHTRNLEADPRASLLFTGGAAAAGDPLASARVTVLGHLAPASSATARARFLARHRDAEMYASFTDFRFFALSIDTAHLIGGFGRIVEVAGADVRSALVG